MCSPSLRTRPNRPEKRVLLIDRCQATRNVRASVLWSRGIEVHVADSLQAARFLWQPNLYHFMLLDVRRHPPGEALEFYEQIKAASPNERFVFLVGPPAYISLSWPDAVTATEQEPQLRAETTERSLAAA
jgi:DNA-binding NtrC family response regulator